ncbi:MAG: hypothetical protein RMI90_02750 [Thermoguttaceae bacterium]|nr:hypothetical protein [Thermoguttaceae bacterium]
MACEALEGWAGQARAAERPREACGDCGGRMRAQGRPRGYVATTVGVIRLCRQRWRCGGCGRESYPEDRQVRFRLHGVSWQLAKRLSWLGAWAPAEQVWKRLWEDCGVRLSKQTIQQVAYEAGGLFCEQEDGQRRQMVAGGAKWDHGHWDRKSCPMEPLAEQTGVVTATDRLFTEPCRADRLI